MIVCVYTYMCNIYIYIFLEIYTYYNISILTRLIPMITSEAPVSTRFQCSVPHVPLLRLRFALEPWAAATDLPKVRLTLATLWSEMSQ